MSQAQPTIHIATKYPTKRHKHQAILKSLEHPGKPKKRLSGGWIHDLCASKRIVLLCSICNHKFDPKRLGYIRDPEWHYYGGKCDGCDTWDMKCAAYYYEPHFLTVRSTAAERRALSRSRAKRVAQGSLG